MPRVEPLACPRCKRPVQVDQQDGGRGTGDLTSYCVDCECGVNLAHLGNDGTTASATRDWNRWVREQLGLPQRGSRAALSQHVAMAQPRTIRSYMATGKDLSVPVDLLRYAVETRLRALVDCSPRDRELETARFMEAAANLALGVENAAITQRT